MSMHNSSVGAHYIHGATNQNQQNHPNSLTPSKVGQGKGQHILSPHGPLNAIHGLNSLNLNQGAQQPGHHGQGGPSGNSSKTPKEAYKRL
mmetsp:Transcript_17075/g.26415  ORF Transcript_17075/g.26415 Transcript_17075/m.26415 type:complete len:90 (+) Transcript_17075:111-380(+)